MLASDPVRILNQIPANSGIPVRFSASSSCSSRPPERRQFQDTNEPWMTNSFASDDGTDGARVPDDVVHFAGFIEFRCKRQSHIWPEYIDLDQST